MRVHTAVTLLVALVACGSDITTPDMSEVAGDYVLRTINGGSLPVRVLTQPNLRLDIVAETLYMTSSGAFSDVTHYIRADSLGVVDQPADTLGGTWTVKGDVVSFTGANGAGTFTATIGGASLLIEGNGLAFRYIK